MVSERVAVITGAGSGIGKASALALLADGWSVVFAGRRVERLKEAAKEGKQFGQRTLVVPIDVTDPAAIKNLFAQTKETFGRLDLLFNNAGVSMPGLLEDLTYDQWHAVPDGVGNSIAFIAWHYLRTEDNIINWIIQNRRPTVWMGPLERKPRPFMRMQPWWHSVSGTRRSVSRHGTGRSASKTRTPCSSSRAGSVLWWSREMPTVRRRWTGCARTPIPAWALRQRSPFRSWTGFRVDLTGSSARWSS